MTFTLETIPTVQQQFEQLFLRSRRRAYNLAYRLTQNTADAEDLTQDAYLRAWQHFDRFDRTHSFEAWLFTILTHLAIDLQRHKKRVRMYSLDMPRQSDADPSPMFSEVADPAADPQEIVVAPLLEERLEAALSALPAVYREVILLGDVECYSYLEIAKRLDCALGTVRSRLYRARQQVRRFLETGADLPPRCRKRSAGLPCPGLCTAAQTAEAYDGQAA